MDGKKARWLGGGGLAVTLLAATLVSGQGLAMAQNNAAAPTLEPCGTQYGTYIAKGTKRAPEEYIRGDDGYLYHHGAGLGGNASFKGLQNGDRVAFDYAKNAYGGGGPTNICRG
jgi:hypothetical protein